MLGAVSELVAQQHELPVKAPGFELLKGFADGYLALGLRVKCLDLVRLGEEAVRLVEEVPKVQIVQRHSVSPFGGERHKGKKLRPVRALPAVPPNEGKHRQALPKGLHLFQDDKRDWVLGSSSLQFVGPFPEEIFKLVNFAADRDPVPPREVILLLSELIQPLPRGFGLLDVVAHLCQGGEVRLLDTEVLAVLLDLLSLCYHIFQGEGEVLQA